MSGDPDRERILRELGLSEYAARAYLALLELGPAEARDIARLAKVPIAKVYSTLDQLALKGFLVVLPETPRKYMPQRMADVMRRIAAEHAQRAAEADSRAAEMDELFQLARKEHASDRGPTVILRGRRVVSEKLMQFAARADDILVLASDNLGARTSLVGSSKPPRILTLAATGERAHGGARSDELANRRHAPNPVTFALFDDETAMLAHHVPDDTRQHEGFDVAVVIHEEAIVRALRDVLEHAWAHRKVAVPLQAPARRHSDH